MDDIALALAKARRWRDDIPPHQTQLDAAFALLEAMLEHHAWWGPPSPSMRLSKRSIEIQAAVERALAAFLAPDAALAAKETKS